MKYCSFLFVSIFLFSQSSFASTVSCENPIALRKIVKECNQNFAYSTAAKKCVSSFENAVKSARTSLDLALNKFSQSEKQSLSLRNTKLAYENAIAALLTLSQRGKILSQQIALYKNEVVLPEDFAAIGASGFSAKIFLDNNPCYKDSQDLLGTYEKIMDSLSEEVRLTAEISKKMLEKAQSGEKNLENTLSVPEPLDQTNANEALPSQPKGKTPRSSDISGTKENKFEEKK